MAQRISIVDYGMGNLRSVQKALQHVAPDARVEITAQPEAIRAADRVVFPGQGAMPDCMRALNERKDAVCTPRTRSPSDCRPADALRAQRRGDTGLRSSRAECARSIARRARFRTWAGTSGSSCRIRCEGSPTAAASISSTATTAGRRRIRSARGRPGTRTPLPRPSHAITFSRRSSTPRKAAARA